LDLASPEEPAAISVYCAESQRPVKRFFLDFCVDPAEKSTYTLRDKVSRVATLMELRDALTQISEIRQQVARTEVFRGYRAVPIAFSGVLAVGTAAVQAVFLPEPLNNLGAYLALWIGAAMLSILATGVEMTWHCRYVATTLEQTKTRLAIGQFTPSVVVGGLLTWVLVAYARESVWMLPGLWSLLFSLGIFASYKLLPRPTFAVAVFYMLAGALCLVFAQGERALAPWAMGLPFGVGQLSAAVILYWTLERPNHDEG
jgi:hypothetical protein